MASKFQFDIEEEEGELDQIEYNIPILDEPLVIFKPTSGQLALLASAFSGDSEFTDSSKAVTRFFKGVTDEVGFSQIMWILENPRITDSLEQVVRLAQDVMQRFAGNPTKQPSDYLAPQRGTGQSSTATRRRAASTPSPSRRTGSATSSTRGS
jgi:hypothetical protein